ncbi:ATP-binding mismatch repair protein [Rhizina undulata]
MATIKPIEGRSVHQIQSGQVIGDGLSSAVKELVENSLDAHATSIEIRFKNYGLDSLEVIDNGDGITSDNYESIALKHYTSKLTTYADLESVTTFGFRGEALSSLCALSTLHIITATASEAPKGTKLEFETSGKLKSKSVSAAQKGTTVFVEQLFKTLPVRRKELERNVKREYTKVLGFLQAYAAICVGVKFSVFNQPAKGKRTPVFATKGNPTTRENIANVFGAKTLTALVPLELEFEMVPTQKASLLKHIDRENRKVKIIGHISRPVVGGGRNAPDRQMFFVNGRPCILPQIARAINEVYKGFNVTQSPFIFADLQLDTNAYDVNVSPDKRTILLHDQAEMLESLKVSLTELFESHEQTVPQAQLGGSQQKLPAYKQLTVNRTYTSSPAPDASSPPPQSTVNNLRENDDNEESRNSEQDEDAVPEELETSTQSLMFHSPAQEQQNFKEKMTTIKSNLSIPTSLSAPSTQSASDPPEKTRLLTSTTADELSQQIIDEEMEEAKADAEKRRKLASLSPLKHRESRKVVSREPATITIGGRTTVVEKVGLPNKRRKVEIGVGMGSERGKENIRGNEKFLSALSRFAAPGSQVEVVKDTEYDGEESGEDEREEEGDEDEEEMEVMKEDEIHDKMSVDGDIEKAVSQEPHDLQQDESGPLFLPGHDSDEESAVEAEEQVAEELQEEEEETGDAKLPADEDNDNANDSDYLSPSANSKRAQLRAEARLRELESQPSEPTSETLERAFRILQGSKKRSTANTVRFVKTSISQIASSSQYLSTVKPVVASSGNEVTPLIQQSDSAAEERLTLTVKKQDFLTMTIKGQFNKGFILATRGSDLFIIDQHASDEKYNFEMLQRDTVVQSQRLVVPKCLDLMAMEEEIVVEALDVLKRNGFGVEVRMEESVGRRCWLVSLPMSRETVFGIKDLEELVHLIHQNQGSALVRPSKVRAMFAMRACRKSVMVGKALTIKFMEKIVRHMSELDKPWNCPHGRPTMRHLVELGTIKSWNEEDEGGLQWRGERWREMLAEFGPGVGGGDDGAGE